MIKTLPVQPRRQGNHCALDAARRHSKKLQPKKRQAQELCRASHKIWGTALDETGRFQPVDLE
jgi:hypothetical protein